MFRSFRSHAWKLTLIAAVVFLISGIISRDAGAIPQLPSEENDNALLRDAKIYAANNGVSLDEAVNRFNLQLIAGDLDAELSVKETKTFAGLWIEHTPEFRLIVLSTPDGNQVIKSYIPEQLVNITEVRNVKISLVNLEAIQKKATADVRSLGIAVESRINVIENRVELFVTDRHKLDSALHTGKIRLSDDVEVIIVKVMGKPEAYIYGGRPLSSCTSGFSVKKSGDPDYKGITTAGHCGNNLSFNGTSLTFIKQINSGSYDIQWHTAPDFIVTNKIKDGGSTTRNITSTLHRNNQVVGAYVCKYGKVTGYTCGYISSKTLCPSSVQNCSPTFILVDNTATFSDLSSSGDSGGPWFLGNAAYGTHVGHPADDPNDAVYMAVNYVGGLGVSVMIAP